MSQVVTNLGTGGAALNARLGSGTGADSNDPKFLPWEGENYVYLPGVAGNRLTVPDEAALDITGDVDIRIKVALDNWATQSAWLASKWSPTDDQRSFYVLNTTTGRITLAWSSDGTLGTVVTKDSDVHNIANGSTKWIRVTLDTDNGASGNDVAFYTSDDGVSWTQLGATQTTAGTTSVFASTTDLTIGGYPAGGGVTQGKLFRTQILDGIDGITVLDVDTSLVASGSDTSFTARTGQTVTINRSTSGRKSVAVTHPVWLFGTDDYMEVADNALLDFGVTDDFTAIVIVRQWATPTNVGRYLGKRSQNASPSVGWAVASNGTALQNRAIYVPDTGSSKTADGSTVTAGALSLFGMKVDRAAEELTAITNSTVSAATSTTGVGSPSNAIPLRVGRDGGVTASYQDFEFIAAAVFRRALTAGEIAAITTYYQNRVA